MCNSKQHEFLKALPKCEHHMHLEGALTSDLLFALAFKNDIRLPNDDPAFASAHSLRERYNNFSSLDDFLHYYYIGMSVLLDESDFEALAWDYFQHASEDGVAHAEVFFDPQAHLSRGVAFGSILSGFNKARARAKAELDISSELICCFLRHLPAQECLSTFEMDEVQSALKQGLVSGIGLDSSEKDRPPELFKEIFQRAKTSGFRRTAHAGEEGPASYIRDALDILSVDRVDHGVRLINDSELMKRVAEEKILLTICPISNVFLKGVSSVSELPIRKFLDAGVAFSINSDDPAYFGNNYILDNYCEVQKAFELSVEEWDRICQNSIRGSWCDEDRKKELYDRLRKVIGMQA